MKKSLDETKSIQNKRRKKIGRGINPMKQNLSYIFYCCIILIQILWFQYKFTYQNWIQEKFSEWNFLF